MKFDPTILSYGEYRDRLILGACDEELPKEWIATRLPRPSLPVDVFLERLQRSNRKAVLRAPADLEAQHPLGVCPYALARSGIAHATLYATLQSHRDNIRSELTDPLKRLKDTPQLSRGVHAAFPNAHFLLRATEHFDIEIPHLRSIVEALLVLKVYLPEAQAAVAAAHLELSQNAGNVWRLSFIGALASVWWQLAGQDPVPSAGPFQEFVISAWCSLSPGATPEDADWRSAIKTALSRVEESAWRVEPRGRTQPRPTIDAKRTSAWLDNFAKLGALEDQVRTLREEIYGRSSRRAIPFTPRTGA